MTSVRTGTRGASARNSSPSARVRLATEPSARSPQRIYALPSAWTERWPLRRYGSHGLSHSYASRHAGELLERPAEQLRLVTAHLGAGAATGRR